MLREVLHNSRLCLMVGVVLCLLIHRQPVQGQTDAPRFELGAHLAMLRLNEHEPTDVGVGGRVTHNLTNYLALEGEINFFPRELRRVAKGSTVPSFTDRRIQGLLGIKAGMRFERVGVFGKLRPGFINFHNRLEVVCITQPCPPLSSGRTEFALDLGGVIEFYPARHFVVRVDLGDTWIRGTGNGTVLLAGKLGHNFQTNIGAGVRF